MQTYTQTHTSTYARHIASKVAADMKRLQRLYAVNSPTDKEINDYQEEMFLLLETGCLGEVTYGFKRSDSWVVALKYRAIGGHLAGGGDDSGGIRPEVNIAGTAFSSFLIYATSASTTDIARFKQNSPIRRTHGAEPGLGGGQWADGRKYVSGELGVQRAMIARH